MVACVVMVIMLAFLIGMRSKVSAFLLFLPLFLIVGMFDFQAQRRVQIVAVAALLFSQITYGTMYVTKSFFNGHYSWVTKVMSPPSNVDASEPSVIWAAEKVLSSGALCLFDMSNSGLIIGVALLPSCSRFTYPIYAASRYEDV